MTNKRQTPKGTFNDETTDADKTIHIKFDFEPTVDGLVDYLKREDGLQAFAQALIEVSAGDGPVEYRTEIFWEEADTIAENLEKGLSLSPKHKHLLIDHLRRGPNFKEKQRTGRSSEHFHHLAFLLVGVLVGKGLKPFRNETSDVQCACDVVADAFRKVGWSPTSYSGVKNAFFTMKKSENVQWKGWSN